MGKYRRRSDVKAAIERYFEEHKVPTVSGLAGVLGLQRKDLAWYSGSDRLVIAALQRIESFLEAQACLSPKSGCAFVLKNNFGWQDVKEPKPPRGSIQPECRKASEMTDDELVAFLLREPREHLGR